MDTQKLSETAKTLLGNDKGLLAMDESNQSCDKRFAKLGIPETVEARRDWRELIITTPKVSDSISGFILYDETIRQSTIEGVSFIELITNVGIIPGIKVDGGLKDFAEYTDAASAQTSSFDKSSAGQAGEPKEKVTQGLDGLSARLEEYFNMGARFAKWRAAFTVTDILPSKDCILANAKALAEYAFLCQEAGIVPMVEPEVLMDGSHTLERCKEVTKEVLQTVFAQLQAKGVVLEGMILKPNMVVAGLDCPTQESVEEVAEATINLFMEVVPKNVAGIAFLSGGQSGMLAAARLSAMNKNFKEQLPWSVTFSYSRAIQYPALEIWKGKKENVMAAQESLYFRAKLCQLARQGEYKEEMEK